MNGAIYYSDWNLDPFIHSVCLNQLKQAFTGEVVSVTLNKPLDLGRNIVVEGERSNTMMIRQIITALEASTSENVFFLEHDVLYDLSHFDFTPPKDNIFYYNIHNFRWDYPTDRLITYDGLTSLSSLCVNRLWALEHYKKRMKRLIDSGFDKLDGVGNMQPKWVRALGYEPGTKRRRIGGFSDDVSEKRRSEQPNIDIRHSMTLSNPKTHLEDFTHLPTGWREEHLSSIKNFDLKKMFHV